ncbi:MAG TPA: DUF1800 family protein [Acidimicrobiia bacterium]|nr:DUF1800 family protein [Acidimicrobiia bacterium]
MSAVSDRERVAHVLRRLSMGSHPDLVGQLPDTDTAIARALALPGSPSVPPAMDAPASLKASQPAQIASLVSWWVDQMESSTRLIDERLTWFWSDHFATSLRKVRAPYLMRQQHATIRAHATGSFADLLHAVAKDPAMLIFLDGITNTAGKVNENFGRECLELFTMGRDAGYTQDDVVAASRSFTGWVVNVAGTPASARLTALGIAPWVAGFLPARHDRTVKTLLGHTGALDLDSAIDVILEHPATGTFIATKLYRTLIGRDPSAPTARQLGAAFARDYQIMGLVEAIVRSPDFTADTAVRTRVRTPVEKLVGIRQAVAAGARAAAAARRPGAVTNALRSADYLPFLPPNVGGFPKGSLLLGPHDLVSTFGLLGTLDQPPVAPMSVDALLARFSIFDVSSTTRHVLVTERDAGRRFALAAMSPEFAVT